jgi:hypothetical protein
MTGRLAAFMVVIGVLLAACGQRADCPPLPEPQPRLTKHGLSAWKDHTLRIIDNTLTPVAVPKGWLPVGGMAVSAGCVMFPDDQAMVFIRPEGWQHRPIPVPDAGITVNRYAPKDYDPDLLALADRWIADGHRRVRQVYPLGLLPEQTYDHNVIVLVGRAGDGETTRTRIFPNPGPSLTPLYRNFDIARSQTTFLHTTAHLFNKRRPRPETQPDEPGLPVGEYLELVATWVDMVTNDNPDWIRSRTDFLYSLHLLSTDGDPTTAPDFEPLNALVHDPQPHGIPPVAQPMSFALSEYVHYALSPLLMVALDGLLEQNGRQTDVRTLLQLIHSGRYPGLLAAARDHLPQTDYDRFVTWLRGGRIDPDTLAAGVAYLEANAAAYRAWQKPANWP